MTEEDYAILSSLFTLGVKGCADRRDMVTKIINLEQRVFHKLKEPTVKQKEVNKPKKLSKVKSNGVEQNS